MKKVFDANKAAALPPIINKVLNAPTIAWIELKKFEANQLKASEKRNVGKLKNAILDQGFSFPLIIWSPEDGVSPNYVIDGAGRMAALTTLEKDGHLIPEIPVVFVKAATKLEAKKLVAMASSQFGVADAHSFESFVQDLGGLRSIDAFVSINSTTFATDYIGRVVDANEEADPKKRGKNAPKFEPPEFEPGDTFVFGNHELMVGYEDKPIVGKLLSFIRKEWPYLEIEKNGERL
jgi:hypothetical protein